VPKVGEQLEQATAVALPDRSAPRPKERQVYPLLRNLLKIKWGSN
jgi:sucrose synthase